LCYNLLFSVFLPAPPFPFSFVLLLLGRRLIVCVCVRACRSAVLFCFLFVSRVLFSNLVSTRRKKEEKKSSFSSFTLHITWHVEQHVDASLSKGLHHGDVFLSFLCFAFSLVMCFFFFLYPCIVASFFMIAVERHAICSASCS
jgi:hypothetical protein